MINRIEIVTGVSDTRSNLKKEEFRKLGFDISNIIVVDVYIIAKNLPAKNLDWIARMLTNPITQQSEVNKPIIFSKFKYAFEIGFLPGVTDNIGNTARELIENLLNVKFLESEGVYSAQLYLVDGNISEKQIIQLTEKLYNPLIQRMLIKNKKEFSADCGMGRIAPQVKLNSKNKVDEINLEVTDDKLVELGKKGILDNNGKTRGPLALDLIYMKTIRDFYRKIKRNPTDIELESIAQTWSEHCKHTIFNDPIDEIKDGLYKHYIKRATQLIRKRKGDKDICVSVFSDNSGAIIFDDAYLITDKVETHNSPSTLDPYGGAVTGIVGVNRDTLGFGLGALPVINRYGFCFANPFDNQPLYRGRNFTDRVLSPRRIMDGVVAGVNSGGNCSGIPAPQGFVYFDDRYGGKPLVFVGTVGLIPKQINRKRAYIKKAKPGDYIVMVGGRVGQDGIHGATFSSEAIDSGSPATAVQIGDPITQKKMSDALVKEIRNLGLYNSITDNGAGGLSCSVTEMAKESGGCRVDLDLVPLKYPGLSPWQIWISESQERMTLSVPKKNWRRLQSILKSRGVEATRIGTFNKIGKAQVFMKGKKIMDLPMDFLHDGLPKRPMKTSYTKPEVYEPKLKLKTNLTKNFLSLISRLNNSSHEYISMQYDHEVQAGSVLKPLQGRGRVNADTTITKPYLQTKKAVAISQALFPSYGDIDMYHMAACAIDTAVRNIIVSGGSLNHLALLDNFCWCSSDDPERLGQLKRAAEACFDFSTRFGTPFISGKDSMFNDFKGYDKNGNKIKISIPPTLLISSIGVIENVVDSVSLDLKFPGDLLYLLGETKDELGGSEYYKMISERKKGEMIVGKNVPQVDSRANAAVYKTYSLAVRKGLVASAISVHRGGMAVAIARSAIGGLLGVNINLSKIKTKVKRVDTIIFSESMGRILVSVSPKNKDKFEKIFSKQNISLIGQVRADNKLIFKSKTGKKIIDTTVSTAEKNYKLQFKEF